MNQAYPADQILSIAGAAFGRYPDCFRVPHNCDRFQNMRGFRRERIALAAWFGGAAMLVQILLPLLLGAELSFAGAGALPLAAPSALAGESVAHHHAAHHPGHGSHSGMVACPICLALAAGQAFTASVTALPAPMQAVATIAEAAAQPAAPHPFKPLSYSARAPPVTGRSILA